MGDPGIIIIGCVNMGAALVAGCPDEAAPPRHRHRTGPRASPGPASRGCRNRSSRL